MMNKTLLPPTSTILERNLSQSINCDPPIPLRTLWSADTCPSELLPYLAWQYSVDRWDESWTETTKRKVISEAFEIHKLKGTKEAIRRAVEPFGYLIKVIEWWQNDKAPGTFALEVGILDKGITEDSYKELSRIIDDVKPVSRKMTGLAIQLITKGTPAIHAINIDGSTLNIYPYLSESITTSSERHIGGTIHFIDTMRIKP